MPAIQPPAKVLVTDYVGSWIVRTLLDRGFSVCAAVRAESKTTHFRKVFKDDVERGRLEFAIVSDSIAAGTSDEAVKSVDVMLSLHIWRRTIEMI
ncbi:hypothetical protein ACEPAG_9160 [Sanghuangporus baumii]